ncbi:hypothetical protein T10_13504 [Trichinella papuae]|uniref:Uncharacterized protein n=1 Tax=Trichinella papuae TaxID=268474 RepID=A0A0V1MDM5_9BILA|nr:hypothetical protein T10_13504 [Trichinella papuae]
MQADTATSTIFLAVQVILPNNYPQITVSSVFIYVEFDESETNVRIFAKPPSGQCCEQSLEEAVWQGRDPDVVECDQSRSIRTWISILISDCGCLVLACTMVIFTLCRAISGISDLLALFIGALQILFVDFFQPPNYSSSSSLFQTTCHACNE